MSSTSSTYSIIPCERCWFALHPPTEIFVARQNSAVDTENLVRSENTEVPIIREIMVTTTMSSLFVAFFTLVASSFRTRAALQTEILALRHQLAVFQRNAPRRLRHRCDRLLWVVLYRLVSCDVH
jgi:hypothetical protein